MNRLGLSLEWKAAPPGEAVGPEKPTWARLELRVDDLVLTRHKSMDAVLGASSTADDAIEGPVSGLVEWIVDNFAHVLWEAQTPVPKLDATTGFRAGLPGLHAASAWWSNLPNGADLSRIGAWQQRHTFGAASSQLAVPSIVFVPEANRVGMFVSLPPSALDPSVRLHLSSDQTEHWLERDDLRERLTSLVEGSLQQASADADCHQWVSWLRPRWEAVQRRESSEQERRRLRFGDTVARLWNAQIAPLRERTSVVDGVLSDVAEVQADDQLAQLLAALSAPSAGRVASPRWKKLVPTSVKASKPHEEGYELARRVRHDLRLGTDPIERVDILLTEQDIADRAVDVGGLFRSACTVEERQASVFVDRSVRGLTARRVALATAFGRLLFDGQGKAWGAAFGDHARVQETRRAGAFAAELLAPGEVVTRYMSDPQGLAEDYGISLAAAQWRIHNVARALPL